MPVIASDKKITFAWWNTSLSPHSEEGQASDEHKDYVIDTLSRLIKNRDVDVLCLCEVSEVDVKFLSEKMLGSEFSIYDGTYRDGRKKFDICIIYKKDLLSVVSSEIISKIPISKKIYAGQEVMFIIKSTLEPLALYLVHWSSRIYDYEDSPNKVLLGGMLRDAITISVKNNSIENFIILGDFNEEPFNKSITVGLGASRDVMLVKNTPSLFYNPFWRYMINTKFHPQDQGFDGCGTYYYKGDESNRWKTFDQMIFSSSFVKNGKWFLNESKTEVYYDEDFVRYIFNSKSKFDHLPIISSIERH
ncbi:endonuclease/exonuclease/phosphatase family protein [Pantoea agglomerans]|uniref:endonuclease/exonuclease/phosphatase family protein n=1 Tax=Enterobacter agglomerans TaxID=549 RepID=UPI003208D365